MSAYNTEYQPPFPQLPIYLQTLNEKSGPFLALLDTGADVTFVPIQLLEEIEAMDGGQARVRSHFGEAQSVNLYLVGFQIHGITLTSSYVVGDEYGDEIILGRDVLNKLPIFFDGLQQQVFVIDESKLARLRKQFD